MMATYIGYGLYSSLSTFRSLSEPKTFTLKNFFDVTKIARKIFRTREPMPVLKDIYLQSLEILQNEKVLYSHAMEVLKKKKTKKIKLKYVEIKISKEEDIKIPKDFPIITLDRSLLPEFVYIMHDLHVKILKKTLSIIPEEIEIKKIKYNEDSLNQILIGIKIGLEPLFALALFYNSKYAKNMEFYIDYVRFVNKLAVQFNKTIDILENRTVEKEVLLEIARNIRKIRNEGLL